jgi:hypothetical protein
MVNGRVNGWSTKKSYTVTRGSSISVSAYKGSSKIGSTIKTRSNRVVTTGGKLRKPTFRWSLLTVEFLVNILTDKKEAPVFKQGLPFCPLPSISTHSDGKTFHLDQGHWARGPFSAFLNGKSLKANDYSTLFLNTKMHDHDNRPPFFSLYCSARHRLLSITDCTRGNQSSKRRTLYYLMALRESTCFFRPGISTLFSATLSP